MRAIQKIRKLHGLRENCIKSITGASLWNRRRKVITVTSRCNYQRERESHCRWMLILRIFKGFREKYKGNQSFKTCFSKLSPKPQTVFLRPQTTDNISSISEIELYLNLKLIVTSNQTFFNSSKLNWDRMLWQLKAEKIRVYSNLISKIWSRTMIKNLYSNLILARQQDYIDLKVWMILPGKIITKRN